MSQVKIVTDSAQDFEPEVLKKMGIEVIPLNVHFGDEVFKDGYGLRGKAFYDKLQSSSYIARTSQPSPWEFEQVFDQLSSDGSSVIAITLSSALSGTYQSAVIARDALPDRQITVFDSRSGSGMYGMMSILAKEMSTAGQTQTEIVASLKRMRENAVTVFCVDTLDYLAKNGRIGKAQHFLGTLLNMKPVLSLDEEGSVTAVERVRGKERVISRMLNFVAERVDRNEDLYLCVSHADAPEEAAALKHQSEEFLSVARFYETQIGAVIGTHTGPGTLALFAIPVSAV